MVEILELLGGESMPLRGLVNEVFLECVEEKKEKNAVVSSIFKLTLENGEISGENGEYSFLKCLLVR